MSGIISANSSRHTGLLKTVSAGGTWSLIQTQIASGSGTIDFTSGIDSSYKQYVFKFIDLHPANNGGALEFQVSTNGGSSYGVSLTSTAIEAYHAESDSDAVFNYATSQDKALSTDFQRLTAGVGSDNDQSCSGTLMLFNPSNTTFTKHWISDLHEAFHADFATHSMFAGNFNTTSAIDAVQFKLSNGNMDVGQISLFGIS